MIAQVKSKVDEEEEIRTYTYDFQNRLVRVEITKDEETRTVEYEYDGLGNRISRTETNEEGEKETIYYINDISSPLTQVLQERDGNNSLVQSYVHGLDLVSKISEKNKADYYFYDGLGSVVGLTNGKGSLIARYSYDEWGVPDPSSKFGFGGKRSNTYGFTGEDFDQDTGLLYLRARYYQPSMGRFVSRDPLSGLAVLPMSQNRYLYCANEPVNRVDLSGYYGSQIHYTMTMLWAIEVGFSPGEARIIAIANVQADRPPYKYERRRHLNLSLSRYTTMDKVADEEMALALKTGSLFHLGLGLHSVQDKIAHGWIPIYGKHWLGPWKVPGYDIELNPFYNPDIPSAKDWKAVESATKDYLRRYLCGRR